jgi:hypothetical protein
LCEWIKIQLTESDGIIIERFLNELWQQRLCDHEISIIFIFHWRLFQS